MASTSLTQRFERVADDALLVFQQQGDALRLGNVRQAAQPVDGGVHVAVVVAAVFGRVEGEDADVAGTQLAGDRAQAAQVTHLRLDRILDGAFADRAADGADLHAVVVAQRPHLRDPVIGHVEDVLPPRRPQLQAGNLQVVERLQL